MIKDLDEYKENAREIQKIFQSAIKNARPKQEIIIVGENGPAVTREEAEKFVDLIKAHLKMRTMDEVHKDIQKKYDEIPFIICDEKSTFGAFQKNLESMRR